MRPYALRLLITSLLLVTVVAAGGCTRNRPRPTPTPTPETTPTETATVAPQAVENTPGPQETVISVEEPASAQQTSEVATPTPPPTVPPTATQGTVAYTVQEGETLFSLARRIGVTVDELKRLNNLESDAIQVGQVLQIPATAAGQVPTVTPAAAGPVEHVVQRGEYLKLIAEKYGVSPEEIIRANNLRNPNVIYPGQKLIIPVPGASSGGAAPTPTPSAQRTHIVQRGETLQSIAIRYGVTVRALAEANNIQNVNQIYVGQKLIIP